MTYAIDLVVAGLDLDDEDTGVLLAEHLSDNGWSTRDGRTLMTVYPAEGADEAAIFVTVRAAAAGLRSKTAGRAVRVDLDLVGLSDIARRTGMSRENVRLLSRAERGPGSFPAPVGSTGSDGRLSRLWTWSDVLPWLQEHYQLCTDEASPAGRVARPHRRAPGRRAARPRRPSVRRRGPVVEARPVGADDLRRPRDR